MKFLVETVEDAITEEVLDEATGKKDYFIKGIFAQAELKNRNGRIYPKKILEDQVQKYQQKIDEKSALGELNHPSTPNISAERACHLVTELRWDGNNVLGKAKVLDEEYFPCAKTVKGLIKEGVKFGVSTRGLGSVQKKNGILEVQNDYRMVCIDAVMDPSGIDCWVNGVNEGSSWVYDAVSGLWKEAQMESISNQAKNVLTLEQKTVLFETYMEILSK